MRRLIRWIDQEGRISLGVEPRAKGQFHAIVGTDDPMRLLQGESFPVGQTPVPLVDDVSLELGEGLTLLLPWDPPEVWCAGVTYRRSRDARMAESSVEDVYDRVYAANRPELFLKDAGGRRTVGPFEPIGIRGDSMWNVPEAEIGLVVGERGRILAYTIGNDVSSREIEGANPLYLSQAKIYAGACAVGPSLYVPLLRAEPVPARHPRHRGGRRGRVRGQHDDGRDGPRLQGARRVAREGEPGAAGHAPADRHRPRAGRRVHACCRGNGSRSTCRRSERSRTRSRTRAELVSGAQA